MGQNKAREIASDYHWGGQKKKKKPTLEWGKINFLPIKIDADS